MITYTKKCPSCDENITYKNKKSYRRSIKHGTVCRKCIWTDKRRQASAKRRSEQNRKMWDDPSSSLNSSERSRKISERMKAAWQDEHSALRSTEYRQNHSQALRCAWQDPESGFNDDERRAKQSEARKKAWQDPNSAYRTRERQAKIVIGIKDKWEDPDSRYNSEEYRQIISENTHKRWGSSPDNPVDRSRIGLGRWAKDVKKRDAHTCQSCGSQENLHAHHVIPRHVDDSLACDLDNGITLCKMCHCGAEGGMHSTAKPLNETIQYLRSKQHEQ